MRGGLHAANTSVYCKPGPSVACFRTLMRGANAQVTVVQSPPLPFLLSKTALNLLASALPPATAPPAQAAPAAQQLALVQSLITLLRRLLPLLTATEASILLPQHATLDTAAPGETPAKEASPGSATSAIARPGLMAGPLMDLLTAPLRTQWLQGTSVPQQAADLLVAASGGHDPRDEVLDRLLPFWLPIFACASPTVRSGYGSEKRTRDAAAAAERSSSTHDRAPDAADGEGGYWRVVRVLYSHAVSTLGLLATRQVVTGWRALEDSLQRTTGWSAGQVSRGGEEALSLRQSLQVCVEAKAETQFVRAV